MNPECLKVECHQWCKMSLERAYKACGLCKTYNSLIYDITEQRKTLSEMDAKDFHALRNTATFEAMNALEAVISNPNSKKENILQANKSLDSCKNCDYEGIIQADLE